MDADCCGFGGEQSIAIDVVISFYNCMFRGEALASPSPSRLVISEPSDAGLIHHRFHQYSNAWCAFGITVLRPRLLIVPIRPWTATMSISIRRLLAGLKCSWSLSPSMLTSEPAWLRVADVRLEEDTEVESAESLLERARKRDGNLVMLEFDILMYYTDSGRHRASTI